MAFVRIAHKKKEKPSIPEKYKFRMDIPHGYREITQNYCRRQLGISYLRYNPSEHIWMVRPAAVWVYDVETGSIMFASEENTSIISLILLSNKPKKAWQQRA